MEGYGALTDWRTRPCFHAPKAAYERNQFAKSLEVIAIDGRVALAALNYDNTIRVSDAGTGGLLRIHGGHPSESKRVVALSLIGRSALAFGASENAIRIVDPDTGETLRELRGHSGYVLDLAKLALDGRDVLASASWNDSIRIWDPQTGAILLVLGGVQVSSNPGLAVLTIGGRPERASGSRGRTMDVVDRVRGKTPSGEPRSAFGGMLLE